MKKAKAGIRNKIVASCLMLAGVSFLSFAFMSNSGSSRIAEWTPVNEPLQTAIQALTDQAAAPSTDSSPIASRPPSQEVVPDAPSDQAEPSPGSLRTAEPGPSALSSSAPADSNLLDLNVATQAQLETLPGIGPSKAKAILIYREQHNGFRSVDQLLEVKGIGPKVFERISVLVQAAPRQ